MKLDRCKFILFRFRGCCNQGICNQNFHICGKFCTKRKGWCGVVLSFSKKELAGKVQVHEPLMSGCKILESKKWG